MSSDRRQIQPIVNEEFGGAPGEGVCGVCDGILVGVILLWRSGSVAVGEVVLVLERTETKSSNKWHGDYMSVAPSLSSARKLLRISEWMHCLPCFW